MSNLDPRPGEVVSSDAAAVGAVELLAPREVPLGGPRATTVRRTLPQRSRSLIGAWCFVDHYGPDPVEASGGMHVPPHPHTGLQTVSWLFRGAIEHRDSVGSHQIVRPGELNLMTAGAGIAHSEVSTRETTTLHGAQLWLALPDGERHRAPAFENVPSIPTDIDGATARVFIGTLGAVSSPATVYSDLVGAQLDLPAGSSAVIPVDDGFEHGVLLDAGELTVNGVEVPRWHLAYVAAGLRELRLTAGATPVRALLIGGRPFGEQIVMWWNFVGRSHDEIVEFREAWQREVIDAAGRDDGRDGRFGRMDGEAGGALPAPSLPGVRLRARE